MCSDSDFGLHGHDNFSAWQRGYFVEHGLGRIEEAEEGGRRAPRDPVMGGRIATDGDKLTVTAGGD